MFWKIFSCVMFVALVLSLVFNAKSGQMYYKNFVDIAPNHPNSQHAHLFPGRDYSSSVGITDWDQFFADHFLFVTAGEEEARYQLFSINRQGCRSFTGVNVNDAESINLDSYLNKAVFVRDYTMDDDQGVIIKALDEDTFVNDNFAEYQAACDFPFSRLVEHFVVFGSGKVD